MKPLVLFLALSIGISSLAWGQMAKPAPKFSKNFRLSKPAAKPDFRQDIALKAATTLVPQTPGRLRIITRYSNYNPQTHTWKADSMWEKSEFEYMLWFNQMQPKQTRYTAYSYASRDSAYRQDWFTDDRYQNADTANREARFMGGQWQDFRANLYQYRPNGQVHRMQELDSAGAMKTTALDRESYILDGQGRTVVRFDSSYNFDNGIWQGFHDTAWYQGATRWPYRHRFYIDSVPALGAPGWLYIEQDSVHWHGPDGQMVNQVQVFYRSDGTPEERNYYHVDLYPDSTVTTGKRINYPPSPAGSDTLIEYTRYVVLAGDSGKFRSNYWTSAGDTLLERGFDWYRGFSHEHYIEKWTPSGWRSEAHYRYHAILGPDSLPRRIYHYDDNSGFGTYEILDKTDYEFYSPALLADAKLPKPRPVTLFTFKPNPVRNILTLVSHEPVTRLRFINTLGQGQDMPVMNRRVDLFALPPGLYNVTGFSGDKILGTNRVVKE